MDEMLQRNRRWIGLGALAIVFLCVALCSFGAMASMVLRSGPVYGPAPYVQPPSGEQGAVPPPTYYDYGPLDTARSGHVGLFGLIGGAIGLLFKLLFFGLVLMLFFGLVRRLFWGPRHGWAYHPGGPPQGGEWRGKHHPHWGPWAWHAHCAPWAAEQEPAASEPPAEGSAARQSAPDPDSGEYTGPQE